MSTPSPTHFAFYVSSHGFGHCTRASALTTALLSAGHKITIVTNAAPGPFTAVLDSSPTNAHLNGNLARYRKRDVDPGMLQPKAYDVARQGTVDLLTEFLGRREQTIQEEVEWMKEAGVLCVLSDATFLGWSVNRDSSGASAPRSHSVSSSQRRRSSGWNPCNPRYEVSTRQMWLCLLLR